jgi:hypothetical protein
MVSVMNNRAGLKHSCEKNKKHRQMVFSVFCLIDAESTNAAVFCNTRLVFPSLNRLKKTKTLELSTANDCER